MPISRFKTLLWSLQGSPLSKLDAPSVFSEQPGLVSYGSLWAHQNFFLLNSQLNYISQSPLELTVVIWLSSRKWNMQRSDVCHFCEKLYPLQSLFSTHWLKGENSSLKGIWRHTWKSGSLHNHKENETNINTHSGLRNQLSLYQATEHLEFFVTAVSWS